MLILESVSTIATIENAMCPVEPTKRTYVSPWTKFLGMESCEGLLNISNPGGEVPPIDEEEE